MNRFARTIIAALASVGLVAAGWNSTVAVSTEDVGLALEEVPFPMDSTNQAGWWAPVAEYEGETYFAFDAPAGQENQHEIHIAKRTESGAWSVGCLLADDGSCVTYGDDIGHHQPSIAIDGDGHIHAFVSMHGHAWRYYRSDEPGSVTTLTNHSAEMPDQNGGVTYPTTTSSRTGDVYVIARVASAETGSSPSGRLYRYDVDAGSWERVAVFAHEAGFAIYPDQLQTDSLGRVHVLWEWASGSAAGIRHLGSYLVYHPGTDRFMSASGRTVEVPVTTEAPDDVVYQPLEGEESKHDGTSSVDPGIQSAKLTLLHPDMQAGAVAYRYRPEPGALFEVRWARWNGREWVRETVYSGGQETEAAIGTTYHGNVARVFYAIKPPLCDPDSTATGGLFMAEGKVPGRTGDVRTDWATSSLDTELNILRLAALTRNDGTDVLYLAAPNVDDPPASRLYFATLPREIEAAEPSAETSPVQAKAQPAADDRTNWAYDADVTVSSALTPQSGGKCVVDGNRTDRGSRWISARGDETPTITIGLRQPVEIGEVHVYSGYFTDSQAIVRDFSVQFMVNGQWQSVAEVTGNTRNPALVPVEPLVVTDQVRLVLTDPSGYTGGSDLARIFEVEVYAHE